MKKINEIQLTLRLNEESFAITMIGEKEQFLIESYKEEYNVKYNGYKIGDAIDFLWCYDRGNSGKSQVGWILYIEKFARSVMATCAVKKNRYKEIFEKYGKDTQ